MCAFDMDAKIAPKRERGQTETRASLVRLRWTAPSNTLYSNLSGRNGVAQTSITDLLVEIQEGNAGAYDALLPLVYEEMRRVAARSLSHERDGHTLQPTALVHEAYLRLVHQPSLAFENRRHFYAMAATLMRRILVDYARRAHTEKRGFHKLVPMEAHMDAAHITPDPLEILEVDEAIRQLAALDARQAQIVELRYFAGFSVEETAAHLQVSERTVKRDWAVARAFLHRALDPSPP